jgi:hypothetical protein
MLDIQFLFSKHTIITSPWCGIFHCTPIAPLYLNCLNINNIFKNKNFIDSLQYCKGIITLSNYLSNYFKSKFTELNLSIHVYTLKHPVISNVPLFNYDKFMNNKDKKIIQIGQQLRKTSSIYVLPKIEHYSPLWLTGTKNYPKLMSYLTYESIMYNININFEKVPMKYLKKYNMYDNLLTNNIVFIELFDASANNIIVECIIRNTPILVNKIPGVVDYLGDTYPFYYKNLNEIPSLLTEQNILNAHQYLLNMNKEDLEINYFTKKLMTLLYHLFT